MREASVRAVIGAMLALSGRYNTTGEIILRGFDAWGEPVEEKGPMLDFERLEKDIDEVLRKRQEKLDGPW